MDERREVRIANKHTGVETWRWVYGMPPVARDEQSRKPDGIRLN